MLRVPAEFTCYNGLRVEAICIFFKRFAYPCRYADLILRFSRPDPQLCMIANTTMNKIYDNWHHLFTTFQQPWLDCAKLQLYPIYRWYFINGTVRPISGPGKHQRIVYNGHKKVYSIKFQSIVAPNGLIANLFGPMSAQLQVLPPSLSSKTTNSRSIPEEPY